MKTNEKINCLDMVKFICCIMIIGSHCLPLFDGNNLDYYYGQWLFRFCVPLFLISSGFFFTRMDKYHQDKYIKRILVVYCVSTIIYFPFFCKKGGVEDVLYSFVFGYNHLWYLSALFLSLLLMRLLEHFHKINDYAVIISTLWGGVFFDEYYKLFNSEILCKIAGAITYLGGSRHWLLFALPMILIGKKISQKIDLIKANNKVIIISFVLSMFLGFCESSFLMRRIGADISLDVSLFGWVPAVPLFILAYKSKIGLNKSISRLIRKMSDVAYIIHPGVIAVLGKLLGISKFPRFVLASVVSFSASFIMLYVLHRINLTRKA